MAQAELLTDLDPQAIDGRARDIGREVFRALGRGPSVLDRAWWDDRLMDLTMGDADVKVQLFRFIDVLPALKTPRAIGRHLREYLGEAGDRVPWFLALGVAMAPRGSIREQWLAGLARWSATHMARKFIAGSNPSEALETVLKLRVKHLAFTADLLGEAVISEAEADAYQATCIELLRGLAPTLDARPEDPLIDRDDLGPIPRTNLSLKLTSLTARFDPIHEASTTRRVLERLRPILRVARDLGAYVHVDMEQYAYKDLTLSIFKKVLTEPEFRDWRHVGIVAQAYLPEAEGDLHDLRDWAEERGTPVTIRLVKGAYWDYETLHAQQNGWPIPVYQRKWESDASYERCARFLMEHHDWLRPALASHNVRSLSFALAAAEAAGVPEGRLEVQMLHGMGEPIARALAARGHRARIYTPYGAILPGMAYLVRRLLENTSNESFLKQSGAVGAKVDALLRDPEEVGAMWLKAKPRKVKAPSVAPAPFANEPLTDFHKADARDRFASALDEVRPLLGRTYPLILDGQEIRTDLTLAATCPADAATVVSVTSKATADHAKRAVAASRKAFASWSATPAAERAEVLFKAAAILRRRRFELAAWEVYECGKPWRESDADIAEAIDFCEFYAREMLRLDQADHRDVPGETNRIEHIARGVVVVIPPWNFPLAIPMGMTVAALVTGNAVILKPAEQSPVMGWHLVKILREAGVPDGVLHYLPGVGEEVGQALVDDPGVDLISFTGSRAVGLEINLRASTTPKGQDHVKRVIAEMGGKNAIIVDDDADLDEAVVGVLQSAFGYSGQKCSACSRVIVLNGVYDAFCLRLAEAARSVPVGTPDDPETVVGPVIDADARVRVERYAAAAKSEGRVLAELPIGDLASKGHFVAPLIVADVAPHARIAQEEVFGPILAVLRAADLDDALRIAHSTEYALTGGLYSRSPDHIARVRREYRVGNLYINRTITGALVDRQPFGGFKLSGIGTKAGGTDYLREFLLMRTVTENTMRRGFAPVEEGD